MTLANFMKVTVFLLKMCTKLSKPVPHRPVLMPVKRRVSSFLTVSPLHANNYEEWGIEYPTSNLSAIASASSVQYTGRGYSSRMFYLELPIVQLLFQGSVWSTFDGRDDIMRTKEGNPSPPSSLSLAFCCQKCWDIIYPPLDGSGRKQVDSNMLLQISSRSNTA